MLTVNLSIAESTCSICISGCHTVFAADQHPKLVFPNACLPKVTASTLMSPCFNSLHWHNRETNFTKALFGSNQHARCTKCAKFDLCEMTRRYCYNVLACACYRCAKGAELFQ